MPSFHTSIGIFAVGLLIGHRSFCVEQEESLAHGGCLLYSSREQLMKSCTKRQQIQLTWTRVTGCLESVRWDSFFKICLPNMNLWMKFCLAHAYTRHPWVCCSYPCSFSKVVNTGQTKCASSTLSWIRRSQKVRRQLHDETEPPRRNAVNLLWYKRNFKSDRSSIAELHCREEISQCWLSPDTTRVLCISVTLCFQIFARVFVRRHAVHWCNFCCLQSTQWGYGEILTDIFCRAVHTKPQR